VNIKTGGAEFNVAIGTTIQMGRTELSPAVTARGARVQPAGFTKAVFRERGKIADSFLF